MAELSCNRDGCPVSSTGKCLEGFVPAETCPYVSTVASPALPETSALGTVALPSGLGLAASEMGELANDRPTSIVILAGPVGSGKTTIVTSLYESFLDAPFAGCKFAGSRTLVGFESRCHEARVESGNRTANTAHTPVKSVEFLHLALTTAIDPRQDVKHLLLSDISGEKFKALRDRSSALDEMSLLKRADNFCLLVDGDRITDDARRHVAKNEARLLLRALVDGQALAKQCRIQVVFSKWDVVLHSSDEAPKKFASELKESLNQFAPIDYFEVAARPPRGQLPFAFGLPTLLHSWMGMTRGSSSLEFVVSGVPGRQIDRYADTFLSSNELKRGGINVRRV